MLSQILLEAAFGGELGSGLVTTGADGGDGGDGGVTGFWLGAGALTTTSLPSSLKPTNLRMSGISPVSSHK